MLTDEGRKHIYSKIVDYLSRQGFSESKLLQKVLLLKKRYPQTRRYDEYTKENVLEVLRQMREEGIVNDERYARDVLRQLKDGKNGIRLIEMKMRQRLIPFDIIEKILHDPHEGLEQDYARILMELRTRKIRLEKKYKHDPRSRYLVRGRLQQYCASRGFLASEVQTLTQQVLSEE